MRLEDLFEELQCEGVTLAWGRKGNQLVRKFRCTSGKRKGRLVASPSDCDAPIDLDKRRTFAKTKAQKSEIMGRKAKRTKNINPTSKRMQALNAALSARR